MGRADDLKNVFEEVLSDELAHSKGMRVALDKVYNVLHFFKNKQN